LALGATVLLASLSAWLTVTGEESTETVKIKDELARQAARVRSLEVSYKLETKTGLKPEQLRAIPGFQNQLFLPNDEWRVAFKGRKRYTRQIQPERVTYLAETDEFGLVPPSEPDPKAPAIIRENQKKMKEQYDRAVAEMRSVQARGGPQRKRKEPGVLSPQERDVTRGFNGRTLWMRRPVSEKVGSLQVWAAGSKANWFQVDAYSSAVGLFMPDPTMSDPIVGKAQSMFRLADWVKDRSYTVEDKTEVIEGATCVVLKGSLNSLLQPSLLVGDLSDRVWLDRDHGLALRKREMSRDGQVFNRWVNSEFREVEPGLWLATRCRHDQFSADAPAEFKGKPVVTEEIRIHSVEVNHVPDDRFDMVTKPGDQVEDLRGAL
jgi:hypothetical protein